MTFDRTSQVDESPLWYPQGYLDDHPLAYCGYYTAALIAYDDLIARDPRDVLPHLLRARALWNLDRDDEAHATLQHALHLAERSLATTPPPPRARVHLADALWMLDRRDDALVAYDQAIAAAPEDYEAYLNKGWAKVILAHSHLSEALALLQRADELRPHDADIIYHINLVYWELWDYEACLATLECAISLDPSQPHFFSIKAHVLCYLPGRDAEIDEAENQARALEEKQCADTLARYGHLVRNASALEQRR